LDRGPIALRMFALEPEYNQHKRLREADDVKEDDERRSPQVFTDELDARVRVVADEAAHLEAGERKKAPQYALDRVQYAPQVVVVGADDVRRVARATAEAVTQLS